MKALRLLMERLKGAKALAGVKPVVDAADSAMFGSGEITAGAPHCVDGLDTKRFMLFVIIGLLPAAVAAVHAYGWRMIPIFLVSYTVGGMVEVAFAIVRKHDIHEGFLVTGLIFPLTLPPTVPLWVVAVGVVAGTFFGKEVFGGTGRNIFNPALVGRLFITMAFPAIMTTSWQVPYTDAVTSATPLTIFKTTQAVAAPMDLLLGSTPGSLGEGFRIGIIAGGLFLVLTRVSDWRIPFTYIGTVAAVSAVGSHFMPAKIAPPLFQILSGGLMLGAFFMATDPVTSPFTRPGRYIFGMMCGLLTVLIRSFSGYVEGVMFTIVILNSLTPIMDHVVMRSKYGGARRASPAAGVNGRAE